MMMGLAKRYCVEYINGTVECSREGGFWYTDKGQIIKWSVLGALFVGIMLWFVGGYLHARRRLKAGKPLLAYHRFLISWQQRKRYTPHAQNHFTFYAPNGQPQQQPYHPRPDGAWPEAPPTYQGGDAPPMYFAPPGATKASPNQTQSQGVEMGQFGAQQNEVVGGRPGDVEQGHGGAGGEQALPPRPPMKVKAALRGFTERFRK